MNKIILLFLLLLHASTLNANSIFDKVTPESNQYTQECNSCHFKVLNKRTGLIKKWDIKKDYWAKIAEDLEFTIKDCTKLEDFNYYNDNYVALVEYRSQYDLSLIKSWISSAHPSTNMQFNKEYELILVDCE